MSDSVESWYYMQWTYTGVGMDAVDSTGIFSVRDGLIDGRAARQSSGRVFRRVSVSSWRRRTFGPHVFPGDIFHLRSRKSSEAALARGEAALRVAEASLAFEDSTGWDSFLLCFGEEMVLFTFDKSRKAGASGLSLSSMGVLQELVGVRIGGMATGGIVTLGRATGAMRAWGISLKLFKAWSIFWSFSRSFLSSVSSCCNVTMTASCEGWVTIGTLGFDKGKLTVYVRLVETVKIAITWGTL